MAFWRAVVYGEGVADTPANSTLDDESINKTGIEAKGCQAKRAIKFFDGGLRAASSQEVKRLKRSFPQRAFLTSACVSLVWNSSESRTGAN